MTEATHECVRAKVRQADRNYHRYHLADRLLFSSGLVLGVAGGILMVSNPAFAVLGLVSTGLFTINSTLEFADRAQKQRAVKMELVRMINPDVAQLNPILQDLDPELFRLASPATIRLTGKMPKGGDVRDVKVNQVNQK